MNDVKKLLVLCREYASAAYNVGKNDSRWTVEAAKARYLEHEAKIREMLIESERLVEQTTLERAAKHFADHNYGEFYRDEVAQELRALKDSHD